MSRKPFSLAAAAVSALAIGSMCVAPTLALADTGNQTAVGGASQAAANPSLVNPTATVQLNIEKHLGATTGQTNNGTTQTVTTPKLQGVNFDIYQVQGVDLTTNAGWTTAAAAEGVTPAADMSTVVIGGVTYQLTKVATVTTDATGTATFTKDNGVGLYFVKENLTTSGTITQVGGSTIDKSTITPSAPFFVTLPMTNPDNLNSWMYDVRVYPKNQSDTITKTVNDETTYTVGKDISYTLTSSISPVEKLGFYYLADDNAYVTASSVSLAIKGTSTDVALNGCNGATGAGTGSCDYYYWLDSDAKAGSQLKIQFTDAGLVKLQDAKKADTTAQVVTTINGTVASLPDSGVVPNTGTFIPNSDWYVNNGGTPPTNPPVTPPGTPVTPPTPETPGIPSNEVKSYFGSITIDKKLVNSVAGDTATGAEFAVYVDPTPTTECTADDVKGTALMTKAITADNKVTFDPLRASNWADNAALADASAKGWIQYCVVETKAPTGYNLNAQPITATINWATGTTTLTRNTTLTINNEKSNVGNELPLTGGQGIAALSLGGIALIGGGAAYYARESRKRKAS